MDPDKGNKEFYNDSEETRLKKSLGERGKPSNAKGHKQTKDHIEKCINTRKNNRSTWSEEKKVANNEAISKGHKGKPKKYKTVCNNSFLCRISDRKEMNKPNVARYIPELKIFF